MAPFSTRWCCFAYWDGLLWHVSTCMHMHETGETGITQLPSFWHRNPVLSPTRSQVLLLCLWLPSTPRFYTLCDQDISLPGGTSLLSFISDGAVFPNSLLLRSFDPFRYSGGGFCERWPGAGPPPGMFGRPCC